MDDNGDRRISILVDGLEEGAKDGGRSRETVIRPFCVLIVEDESFFLILLAFAIRIRIRIRIKKTEREGSNGLVDDAESPLDDVICRFFRADELDGDRAVRHAFVGPVLEALGLPR